MPSTGEYDTGTLVGSKAVFTPHEDVEPADPQGGKGYLYVRSNGGWYVKHASTEQRLATVDDTEMLQAEVDGHESRLDALEADLVWNQIIFADPQWQNWADTNYSPSVYAKDPMGFVHCEGLIGGITGAVAGDIIWYFPVGYRPRKNLFFAAMASSGSFAQASGATSTSIGTSGVVAQSDNDGTSPNPNVTATASSHSHGMQNHDHSHAHSIAHSHTAVSHAHDLSFALGYHAVLLGVYHTTGAVQYLGSGWNPVGGWLAVNFNFFAA